MTEPLRRPRPTPPEAPASPDPLRAQERVRRNVRRTAIALALVAVTIYAGYIVAGMIGAAT